MPTRRENCVTALTFEEARERSRLLDVRGYRVDLDVTGGGEAFGSVTVVRFGCRAPGAGSFIELSPARLRRAVLNGREVDPATLTGNRLPPRAGAGRGELPAPPPMATYLVTLVAGPYFSISTEHHGVPFGLHTRQSLAGPLRRDAADLLPVARACFDRYREIFAEPYPYDSYDQAFVPELESGAVENPGCVTFPDDFLFPSAVTRAERQLRAMVIAHEMAHMWFGDLVTMRWWNDVWLSESFATYMGFRVLADATAFTGTWTDFALTHKTRGYDADQRASAHPVAPEPREVPDTDAARSSYDDISYAKGASALRQLVAWLGWPVFLAGIY